MFCLIRMASFKTCLVLTSAASISSKDIWYKWPWTSVSFNGEIIDPINCLIKPIIVSKQSKLAQVGLRKNPLPMSVIRRVYRPIRVISLIAPSVKKHHPLQQQCSLMNQRSYQLVLRLVPRIVPSLLPWQLVVPSQLKVLKRLVHPRQLLVPRQLIALKRLIHRRQELVPRQLVAPRQPPRQALRLVHLQRLPQHVIFLQKFKNLETCTIY